jgi:hypothetical protein
MRTHSHPHVGSGSPQLRLHLAQERFQLPLGRLGIHLPDPLGQGSHFPGDRIRCDIGRDIAAVFGCVRAED